MPKQTDATRTNGLRVGDKVIDFRGEKTGTVEAIETGRYPKSDKVTVLVNDKHSGRPSTYRSYNYETVWSKI